MKYIIPILVYFGIKPKRIAEITGMKIQNVYHATSKMTKENTIASANEILASERFNNQLKEQQKK